MYKYDFDEVWQSQGVGNVSAFMKLFKERLITRYKQEWFYNIHNKERYQLFRTFKSELVLSTYLIDLKHVQSRTHLIRFRLGVSQLNTHKLRYSRANNANTNCPFCRTEIESELHFLFVCPAYADLRNYYIPHKYFRFPCLYKLTMRMATTNTLILLRLSKFLKEAFERRTVQLNV